ncbi:MAG TPA: hypothetical protein VEZ71_06815, partial [Archangium sp.]|nr:hypothetical protein [Archangium sp.]
TVPRPKRLPPDGGRVVAMGWRRSGGLLVVSFHKAMASLCVHGTLRGHSTGRTLSIPQAAWPKSLQLPLADGPPVLALSQVYEGREVPLVLDSARSLHQFASEERPSAPLLQGVTALFERRGGLFFVDRDREEDRRKAMPRTGCLPPNPFKGWTQTLPVKGSGEAYFGQARDSSLTNPGPPLAIRHRPGEWWVTRDSHDEQKGERVTVAEGLRVVGLWCWPVDTPLPGLVVLGGDQRTFYRVTADGASEFLVTAPARVVSSGVSPAMPLMAWLTETGEVGGWSFQHRALVYRSVPGGRS